jgi:hypothetical protein
MYRLKTLSNEDTLQEISPKTISFSQGEIAYLRNASEISSYHWIFFGPKIKQSSQLIQRRQIISCTNSRLGMTSVLPSSIHAVVSDGNGFNL